MGWKREENYSFLDLRASPASIYHSCSDTLKKYSDLLGIRAQTSFFCQFLGSFCSNLDFKRSLNLPSQAGQSRTGHCQRTSTLNLAIISWNRHEVSIQMCSKVSTGFSENWLKKKKGTFTFPSPVQKSDRAAELLV